VDEPDQHRPREVIGDPPETSDSRDEVDDTDQQREQGRRGSARLGSSAAMGRSRSPRAPRWCSGPIISRLLEPSRAYTTVGNSNA
jgi:hypothetical protein